MATPNHHRDHWDYLHSSANSVDLCGEIFLLKIQKSPASLSGKRGPNFCSLFLCSYRCPPWPAFWCSSGAAAMPARLNSSE